MVGSNVASSFNVAAWFLSGREC